MPALHRINIFLAFIALHRLQEFLQVARLALKEGAVRRPLRVGPYQDHPFEAASQQLSRLLYSRLLT